MGTPSDGCQTLTMSADAAGSIIILERGSCMFALKVKWNSHFSFQLLLSAWLATASCSVM